MKKSLKWIFLISGVVLIILLSIFSILKPLTAEVLQVQPKTVEISFREEGTVTAQKEETIYPAVQGLVEEVYVKEGDRVKEGDMLLKIDTKDLIYQLTQLEEQKISLQGQEKKTYDEMNQQLVSLKAQLQSLEGQKMEANSAPYKSQISQQQIRIDEAKRQLKLAEDEYQRMNILFESGAVSQKEKDSAEQALNQAKNNLKIQEEVLTLLKEQTEGSDIYYEGQKKALSSQIALLESQLNQGSEQSGTIQYYKGLIDSLDAQIEQLKYQIERSEIKAPFDGIVKDLKAEKGIPASPQALLVSIFQPDIYEIETFVLTEDVIGLKEGMAVELIQERKDQDVVFEGIVDKIAPSAEDRISSLGLTEQRVKVTIKLNNKEEIELRPGYVLDVKFVTYKEEDRLAVPKSVLFPYEDGEALWVVRNGKAIIQPIVKGLENDQEVVVLEGLEEGDQVIKNPQLEGLKEGKRLKINNFILIIPPNIQGVFLLKNYKDKNKYKYISLKRLTAKKFAGILKKSENQRKGSLECYIL